MTADPDNKQDKDERIRVRAYHLWESAGRPHGDDQAHWHAAVRAESATDTPAPAKRQRRKMASPTAPTTPAARRGRTKKAP